MFCITILSDQVVHSRLESLKKMLESRPEDALVKLVKTVETVETACTARTAHTFCSAPRTLMNL